MTDIQTEIAFFVLAVAGVASALGVITFKNAVHSALSLILTLLFLALFYLQLGAMFIAIVQILIYAGAIMVLFLFVVTMLASEADDTELQDRIPWQRWIAGILGLALVGALSYLLFTGTAGGATASGGSLSQAVNAQGNIEAFGEALFHGFAFPFEVTSLLIVVAILGAMVLGRAASTRPGKGAAASTPAQTGSSEKA
jgi:NADH-quinone oxidoreductase subunit J